MKPFLAIMKWNGDNRVAKYEDFDTEAKSMLHIENHLARYPDAFNAPTPNNVFASWLVDSAGKTLSIDFPVVVPPTDEERIDQVFPQSDSAHVIIEGFKELQNQIIDLGNTVNGTSTPHRTFEKVRNWLKNQLP